MGHHQKVAESLAAWASERLVYLKTKEVILSSVDAKKHLSLLEAFNMEKAETMEDGLQGLKTLGNDIRTAKYSTEHSQWSYAKPQEVNK